MRRLYRKIDISSRQNGEWQIFKAWVYKEERYIDECEFRVHASLRSEEQKREQKEGAERGEKMINRLRNIGQIETLT
jgi:hypothetical protein